MVEKILVAQRFVGLYIVRANRTRGSDSLLAVLIITDCFRNSFDEFAHSVGKLVRSLFQIILLLIHWKGSFRISDFEFRIYLCHSAFLAGIKGVFILPGAQARLEFRIASLKDSGSGTP